MPTTALRARSVAVDSGDSAVRARKTRSGRDRRTHAIAARPRRPVSTDVVALIVVTAFSRLKSQALSVLPFRVGAVTSPLCVPMMSPAFNGEALSRVIDALSGPTGVAQDHPGRSQVAAHLVTSGQMGTEGTERGADTPPAKRVFPHGGVGVGQAGQRTAVQGGDTGGVDAAFFREVAEVDERGGRDGAHLLRVLLGADGSEEAAHAMSTSFPLGCLLE